jgi:putative FmdB family regulatory protein
MPIYDYLCTEGHRFERMQSFSEDALTVCEVCGEPVHRVLHAPAVHFKGKGFYSTDYGRGGKAGGGDKSESGSSSSESGSGSGESSGSSSESGSKSSDSKSSDSGSKSSDSKSSSGSESSSSKKSDSSSSSSSSSSKPAA